MTEDEKKKVLRVARFGFDGTHVNTTPLILEDPGDCLCFVILGSFGPTDFIQPRSWLSIARTRSRSSGVSTPMERWAMGTTRIR